MSRRVGLDLSEAGLIDDYGSLIVPAAIGQGKAKFVSLARKWSIAISSFAAVVRLSEAARSARCEPLPCLDPEG